MGETVGEVIKYNNYQEPKAIKIKIVKGLNVIHYYYERINLKKYCKNIVSVLTRYFWRIMLISKGKNIKSFLNMNMFSINLEAFILWGSFNKIRCESEYENLKIINDLKKKYKKIKKVINNTCKNELNIVQFTWWW